MIDLPSMLEARPQGERRWMARCPAHEDRTPSLSIRLDESRWLVHCFGGCETGAVLAALGLSWSDIGNYATPRRLRGPVARPQSSLTGPRPSRPPSRDYPEQGDVEALWRRCEPVDMPRGECVAEWLRVERGICPAAVAACDLARVLTKKTPLPAWARHGRRSWYASGHRLIVPAFDPTGAMRSVKARAVVEHSKKELAPRGVSSAGLVFADVSGRYVLKHGRARRINQQAGGRPVVVIAEGVPDLLAWSSTQSASAPTYPAVLSVSSGAWTPQIAARIPDRAVVVMDTHADSGGDAYERQIIETLFGRCELRRHARKAVAA